MGTYLREHDFFLLRNIIDDEYDVDDVPDCEHLASEQTDRLSNDLRRSFD